MFMCFYFKNFLFNQNLQGKIKIKSKLNLTFHNY